MKHTYYISFLYETGKRMRTGSLVSVIEPELFTNADGIYSIAHAIEKQVKTVNKGTLMILNWKEISVEPKDKTVN
jgi:hypothetical protein